MDLSYEAFRSHLPSEEPGRALYHLAVLAMGEEPLPLSGDASFSARYEYDHAGSRLAAVEAEGHTTIYLYDLAGNLIQGCKGGEVRNYIWALGKHLARVDGVIGDPASQVY